MVELAAIGLRIALQEEWQWFVADDAVAAGKDDRAFRDIPGLQPAIGPEHLDPLVVAVDRRRHLRDQAVALLSVVSRRGAIQSRSSPCAWRVSRTENQRSMARSLILHHGGEVLNGLAVTAIAVVRMLRVTSLA